MRPLTHPRTGRLRPLLTLLALVALQARAASITVGTAACLPGAVTEVPVLVTGDSRAGEAQFDLTFDPAALHVEDVVALASASASGHELHWREVAPGRVRVIVAAPSPRLLADGPLVALRVRLDAVPTTTTGRISLVDAELVDASAARLTSVALVAGRVQAADCLPGDVHPDGAGDGVLSAADAILLLRKLAGRATLTARDVACADLSPGTWCSSAAWTPTGDDRVTAPDQAAVRRAAAGLDALSCSCSAPGPGPATPITSDDPGDIAPPGARDGVVNVADAVRALRASVGLESLAADDAERADVVPFTREAAALIVRGDRRVDIGDVVTILRAAVDLEQLAWPARAMSVRALASGTVGGFQLVVSGWPEHARLVSWDGPACGDAYEDTDQRGDAWLVTCDVGPGDAADASGTWTYRSRVAVPASSLTVRVEAVDPGLHPLAASAIAEAQP